MFIYSILLILVYTIKKLQLVRNENMIPIFKAARGEKVDEDILIASKLLNHFIIRDRKERGEIILHRRAVTNKCPVPFNTPQDEEDFDNLIKNYTLPNSSATSLYSNINTTSKNKKRSYIKLVESSSSEILTTSILNKIKERIKRRNRRNLFKTNVIKSVRKFHNVEILINADAAAEARLLLREKAAFAHKNIEELSSDDSLFDDKEIFNNADEEDLYLWQKKVKQFLFNKMDRFEKQMRLKKYHSDINLIAEYYDKQHVLVNINNKPDFEQWYLMKNPHLCGNKKLKENMDTNDNDMFYDTLTPNGVQSEITLSTNTLHSLLDNNGPKTKKVTSVHSKPKVPIPGIKSKETMNLFYKGNVITMEEPIYKPIPFERIGKEKTLFVDNDLAQLRNVRKNKITTFQEQMDDTASNMIDYYEGNIFTLNEPINTSTEGLEEKERDSSPSLSSSETSLLHSQTDFRLKLPVLSLSSMSSDSTNLSFDGEASDDISIVKQLDLNDFEDKSRFYIFLEILNYFIVLLVNFLYDNFCNCCHTCFE